MFLYSFNRVYKHWNKVYKEYIEQPSYDYSCFDPSIQRVLFFSFNCTLILSINNTLKAIRINGAEFIKNNTLNVFKNDTVAAQFYVRSVTKAGLFKFVKSVYLIFPFFFVGGFIFESSCQYFKGLNFKSFATTLCFISPIMHFISSRLNSVIVSKTVSRSLAYSHIILNLMSGIVLAGFCHLGVYMFSNDKIIVDHYNAGLELESMRVHYMKEQKLYHKRILDHVLMGALKNNFTPEESNNETRFDNVDELKIYMQDLKSALHQKQRDLIFSPIYEFQD